VDGNEIFFGTKYFNVKLFVSKCLLIHILKNTRWPGSGVDPKLSFGSGPTCLFPDPGPGYIFNVHF
jgi:hypothetical protein